MTCATLSLYISMKKERRSADFNNNDILIYKLHMAIIVIFTSQWPCSIPVSTTSRFKLNAKCQKKQEVYYLLSRTRHMPCMFLKVRQVIQSIVFFIFLFFIFFLSENNERQKNYILNQLLYMALIYVKRIFFNN